jgi:hypothetical protein
MEKYLTALTFRNPINKGETITSRVSLLPHDDIIEDFKLMGLLISGATKSVPKNPFEILWRTPKEDITFILPRYKDGQFTIRKGYLYEENLWIATGVDKDCFYNSTEAFTPNPDFFELEKERKFTCSLNKLKHKKEPILTTEDGVNVYNEIKSLYGLDNNFMFSHAEAKNIKSWPKWYKWFSTNNARLKYVEENKPQFSKKDMIDFAWYYNKHWDLAKNKGSQDLFNEWLKK